MENENGMNKSEIKNGFHVIFTLIFNGSVGTPSDVVTLMYKYGGSTCSLPLART